MPHQDIQEVIVEDGAALNTRTMAESRKLIVSDEPNFPSYVRPEWRTWLPDLNLLFRLLAGTRTMQSHAREYIRQWADEDPKVYRIRSRSEQVFEGLGRTLSAAIGMLFGKPPKIEWPDDTMRAIAEESWDTNIDGGGTSGNVFLKRFTEASLRDGLGVILVDFPTAPLDQETGRPREVSSAEEEELGLKPTWARYDRMMARNWQTGRLDNQDVLTQLTLYEPVYVRSGTFGVRWENRWRILTLPAIVEDPLEPEVVTVRAEWQLWRLLPDKTGSEMADFQMIGTGVFRNKDGEALRRLPVSIAYTGRKEGALVAVPPLLGVAWANLGLWQISTNVRFYLDLVSFPQPTIIGDLAQVSGMDENGNRITVPGKLKVGPMVVVHLSAGSDDVGPSEYKFTVPTSDGFVPNEKAMRAKREDIAALGMSFLDRDKRAAETAEAKRLDAQAENATLATAAQGVDDAINDAWIIHAMYLGLEKSAAPTVTLNRDFEATVMDAQMMMAWISGVEKAGMPPHVLLEAWQKGGQIPEGIDIEELAMEMLANAEAILAQQEADREAEMARLNAGPPEGEEE